MRITSACLLALACLAAPASAAAPPAPALRVDALGDPLPRDAVARLGTERFRCSSYYPQLVALSSDCKLAAILETDLPARVALIDTATGRRLRYFAAEGARTIDFATGKELVCAGDGSSVRVYDVAKGKQVRKFEVIDTFEPVVSVSNDGRVLAVSARPLSKDKAAVAVYDVRTGRRLARFDSPHNARIGLALSGEGKRLASYGSAREDDDAKSEEWVRLSRTVHLWDVATGKGWKKLEVEKRQEVLCVAFSPDGKTLAVHTTAELGIWDLATGKRLEGWLAPSWRKSRLTFSPDGRRLVMTTDEEPAAPAIWNLEANRRLVSARSPDCLAAAVGFREGRAVAVGVRARALPVWDVLSGKRFDRDAGHVAPVAAIHVRDERILTVDSEMKLLAWDVSGRLIEKPQDLRDRYRLAHGVRRVGLTTFSPGGDLLAWAGEYGSMTLHSVRSGEEVFSLAHAHDTEPTAVAFSRDGKLLVDATLKHGVRVHRPDSGKTILRLDVDDRVGGLALDPPGERAAVAVVTSRGEEDPIDAAAVLVWRLDTGKQDLGFARYELKERRVRHGHAKCPLAFAPDGALLAVDDGLGTIHLLDASTGKRRAAIETGLKSLLPPAFSPDGGSLAVVVGREDTSTLALWELRSGKKRWEAALPAPPTALTFDPSGRLLITAHEDTTALVWDISGRSRTEKVRDNKGWDRLVDDLSSGDAQKAFAAQRALCAGADLSVARLARRVKPAAGRPLSDREIAALVKSLDDDDPDVRARSADALQAQGKAAEAALARALAGKPSAELKRSGAALLERIRWGNSPEALRAARAVEVLEWIGTPEAKRLLSTLAKGRPGAALTLEAGAALARLSK